MHVMLGLIDFLKEFAHGGFSYEVQRLPDCSQRHGNLGGHLRIVVSDDREILRNLDPGLSKSLEKAHGHHVRCTCDARWATRPTQSFCQ